MKLRVFAAVLSVSMTALLGVGVGPAGAIGVSGDRSSHRSIAVYDGKALDLSKGWGSARACLVWHQGGVVECFATETDLRVRESQLRPSGQVSPDSSCASSLDLYTGASYTGRHLALWDEGYWQNLSLYSFSQVTVSFSGGACSFHLAQNNNGGGYWYPGYTGPYGSSSDMGPSWDDVISSVYIV